MKENVEVCLGTWDSGRTTFLPSQDRKGGPISKVLKETIDDKLLEN